MNKPLNKTLHIVLNNYENDNRVKRAAECSADLGFETTIYALSKSNKKILSKESNVSIRKFFLFTRFLNDKWLFKSFKYFEMILKMTVYGIKYNPKIIHAHDLNALPIGYLISKFTGAKLIYDSHEFWYDLDYFGSKSFLNKGIFILESFLIKRVNFCVTVSDGISEKLKENYKINRPVVIRNIPTKWSLPKRKMLRNSLKININSTIFLYQGHIAGKGVFDLIEAFSRLNKKNTSLVFLGDGPAVNDLKSKNVENVYFHPYVPIEKLPLYTSDADVGIASIYGNATSNIYCLPNKLFEYIQGGLALIVSDLPEMNMLVAKFKLGISYKFGDVESLKDSLEKILLNKKFRNKCKENSSGASMILNWECEREQLIKIYNNLIL